MSAACSPYRRKQSPPTGWAICSLGLTLALAAAGNAAADVLITGAKIFTGDAASWDAGKLLIHEDKIAAVGGADLVEPASGARRISAPPGAVVTPGFIDPDTTVGLFQVGLSGDPRDDQAPPEDPVHPAFEAWLGLNPDSVIIPTVRMAGLTTVGLSPQGGLFRGRVAFVDLAGATPAQMLVRTPAALMVEAGPVAGPRGMSLARIREVLDDAREFARRRGEWERNASRPFAASRTQLDALLPALEGKLPVVIHAERSSDILQSLALGKDYGLKLIISGAGEGWRVARELAAAGVPVQVRALSNLPGFDNLHATDRNAALLHAAGVKVMLSTMGEPHMVRTLAQHAGNAVRAGLPWSAALAAVTRVPAEAFGLADRGTLAAGKIANVVVWSGDPFELSSRPLFVFIRGVEIPLTSRQTLLFEKYRKMVLGKAAK